MTYLYDLIVCIEHSYVWYSVLTMIFSILAYRISRQFFSFTIVTFAMIFFGFISGIYPYWLLVLEIIIFFAFGILERKKLFGEIEI